MCGVDGESVGERAGERGGESDGIPGRKCRCQTLDLRIRDHTPPNRLTLCAFILTRRGASDYDTPKAQNTCKMLRHTHIVMFSGLIFVDGFPPEATCPVAQGLKV